MIIIRTATSSSTEDAFVLANSEETISPSVTQSTTPWEFDPASNFSCQNFVFEPRVSHTKRVFNYARISQAVNQFVVWSKTSNFDDRTSRFKFRFSSQQIQRDNFQLEKRPKLSTLYTPFR